MRVKQIQLQLTQTEFYALREYLQGVCTSRELSDILGKMEMINSRLETARKMMERFTEGP